MTIFCIACHRTPNEIDEYVVHSNEAGVTPDEFVRKNEGTYNPTNGHFLCTECYIRAGSPSSPEPGGWKAP